MKRSEMVYQVAEWLSGADSGSGSVRESDLNNADELLSKLEDLGMAPPYSDKIFQKNAKVHIEPSGREWEDEST
jgi:hypothetical protein